MSSGWTTAGIRWSRLSCRSPTISATDYGCQYSEESALVGKLHSRLLQEILDVLPESGRSQEERSVIQSGQRLVLCGGENLH